MIHNETSDPIDRHVGARLYTRRLEMRRTRTALAKLLGVSFQQVQKYEAGHSRLSTSALFILARALDVVPDYFFAGFGGDGLDVSDPFARMQTPRCRRQIVALVRSLGEKQG